MTDASWGLEVARPARRAIDRLPAKIAVAVLDYMAGPLLENPKRVGKPLRGELTGLHSVRVGAYRIDYQFDQDHHTVQVVYIDHRSDIYRPR